MFFSTSLILTGTLLANIALFVFVARQKAQHPAAAPLMWFIGSIALWTGGILANLWLASPLIEMIIFATAAAGLTIQILFVLSLTDMHPHPHVLQILIGIGFFFFVMSFWDGALFTTMTVTAQGYTLITNGWLSSAYSLFAFAYTLVPLFLLTIKKRHTPIDSALHKQISLLLWGFIFFFIVNVLTNSILPTFYHIYIFNALGPVFSVIYLIFVAYIILRYHFLDMRLVIQRGLVYIILFSIIVAAYLGILFVVGYLFTNNTSIAPIVSAGIATLFGIFTVPPLEHFFQKTTSTIFFKDSYDSVGALQNLQEILRTHMRIKSLSHNIIHYLADLFHTQRCALISFHEKTLFTLDGSATTALIPQETLDGLAVTRMPHFPTRRDDQRVAHTSWQTQEGYTVVIPLIFDQRTIGVLLLGDKASGDPYRPKDRIFLQQVAFQLSTMLEKAHLYATKERHAALLEEQVAQRTQELATLQKAQERMMLEISHALKTPLAVLTTELDTIAARDPGIVTNIRHTVDAVTRSVTSLLALARMEQESAYQKHDYIDLSALIELLCDYFTERATHEHITLTYHVTPGCAIIGGRDHIEDLLVNLVENAIKYMPRDNTERSIHINLDKQRNAITLAVSDTGSGISATDQERIFDRFYRVKKTHTPDNGGSGLGLAICKAIVAQHHGTIHVQSTPESGTTFIVTLPSVTQKGPSAQERFTE